jgi:hypothetical protein
LWNSNSILKEQNLLVELEVCFEDVSLLFSRIYHVRDCSGKPRATSVARTCSEKPDPQPAGHAIIITNKRASYNYRRTLFLKLVDQNFIV